MTTSCQHTSSSTTKRISTSFKVSPREVVWHLTFRITTSAVYPKTKSKPSRSSYSAPYLISKTGQSYTTRSMRSAWSSWTSNRSARKNRTISLHFPTFKMQRNFSAEGSWPSTRTPGTYCHLPSWTRCSDHASWPLSWSTEC